MPIVHACSDSQCICQLLSASPKKTGFNFFFRISSPHYNLRTSVVLLPDERPNESCRKFVSLAFFFFFARRSKFQEAQRLSISTSYFYNGANERRALRSGMQSKPLRGSLTGTSCPIPVESIAFSISALTRKILISKLNNFF